MEFNIRAISLADGVQPGARVAIADIAGREFEFRAGISIRITLPAAEELRAIPEPEKLLTALEHWARVIRYPEGGNERFHALTPAEDNDGELVFYRIDLIQPARRDPGPRLPVQVTGGRVMSYDECACWLVDVAAQKYASRAAARGGVSVLSRPCVPLKTYLRLAWVGPEIVEGASMPLRLQAIGRVYGNTIIHVAPRSFADVNRRLKGLLPVQSAILCRGYAAYINADAVPPEIPRALIHDCDSRSRADLEMQIRTWVEIAREQIERTETEQQADESAVLVAVMFRGMLSHFKIGPFNHCQKETVLKGIRARHLNCAAAEHWLDANSAEHQDTQDSDKFVLWKEHHDGRQYFLNPRKVTDIKELARVEALKK